MTANEGTVARSFTIVNAHTNENAARNMNPGKDIASTTRVSVRILHGDVI
jgi:hypothetical protein